MKIYQYLFYIMVSFSLIIHNTTILPTLNNFMRIIFVIVTISFGIILVMTALDSMKQGIKEMKK